MIQIKNMSKFQHYKDRKPPWIKLYMELLDNIEFHNLSGDAVKLLIQLWLIAAEKGPVNGKITGLIESVDFVAFRVREPKKKIERLLVELNQWVTVLDSDLLAKLEQPDSPETETETETETDFVQFWNLYPKKRDKAKAKKAWDKLNGKRPKLSDLLASLKTQTQSKDWLKDGGQYIPLPTTWLNGCRWDDEIESEGQGYRDLIAKYEKEELNEEG
jgi:hypothetical protein